MLRAVLEEILKVIVKKKKKKKKKKQRFGRLSPIQEMLDTAGKVRINSWVKFFYEQLHIDMSLLADLIYQFGVYTVSSLDDLQGIIKIPPWL